jgi:hypothetical protein
MYEQKIAASSRTDGHAGSAILQREFGQRRTPIRSTGNPTPLPRADCTAWFEHDILARFVLDPQGCVIHANAKARAMIAAGVLGAGGAFICPSHRNRGEFDALANRLLQGRQSHGRLLFRAGDDAWCLLDLATAPDAIDRIFATARPARCIAGHSAASSPPKSRASNAPLSSQDKMGWLASIMIGHVAQGFGGVSIFGRSSGDSDDGNELFCTGVLGVGILGRVSPAGINAGPNSDGCTVGCGCRSNRPCSNHSR